MQMQFFFWALTESGLAPPPHFKYLTQDTSPLVSYDSSYDDSGSPSRQQLGNPLRDNSHPYLQL